METKEVMTIKGVFPVAERFKFYSTFTTLPLQHRLTSTIHRALRNKLWLCDVMNILTAKRHFSVIQHGLKCRTALRPGTQ